MGDSLSELRDAIGGSVAVALSGGVDSSVVLAAAARTGKALALTARSPGQLPRDLELASEIAGMFGVQHVYVDTREFERPGYRSNGPDRCYVCKREILSNLWDVARARGYVRLVEGSNADDSGEFRPGMRAVREQGVVSPLLVAGWTKRDVRDAARQLGLPNADRPSSGCLATRVQTGQELTPALLGMVSRAEEGLERLGLGRTDSLRARVHGSVVRIEAGAGDREWIMSHTEQVVAVIRGAGFPHVALDLEGYRRGSQDAGRGDGAGQKESSGWPN